MEDSTFYLTFNGLVLDAPIANLIVLIENTIKQEGITHLYVAMNTPGGSASAGIALYHYLKAAPIKITTHNIGQVDSIGNVIFLSGDERVASPATSFMLHGVSVQLSGQFSKTQLKEYRSQIEQDETRIESITTSNTKLSKAQLARFFREGRSLSPTEAKRFGIATHIREFEVPSGAKSGVINTFPTPN